MKKRFEKKLTLNKLSVSRLDNIETREVRAGFVGFDDVDLGGGGIKTDYCIQQKNLLGLISISANGNNPQVCDEGLTDT